MERRRRWRWPEGKDTILMARFGYNLYVGSGQNRNRPSYPENWASCSVRALPLSVPDCWIPRPPPQPIVLRNIENRPPPWKIF